MLRTIRKIITLNYLENCCLDCFKSKETNFDTFRVPSIILEANGVELGHSIGESLSINGKTHLTSIAVPASIETDVFRGGDAR